MKSKFVFNPRVQFLLALTILVQLQSPEPGFAQSCVMTCPLMDEPVGIFLDEDCEDTLTLESLGVTTGDCVGPFTIEIMDNGMDLGDIVTADMIGGTFMVIVTSETEQQNCMASITVFDKLPPSFTCPEDVTVGCTTDLNSIPISTEDDATDCSDVTIYTNDEFDYFGDCNGDFISKVTRTYIVVDEYGNSTSCTQMILFEALELEDVIFPPDLKGLDALNCSPPPDTSPAATGYPEIDGFPIFNGLICNISATYSDETASLCSGGYKIFRTWTVTNWCNGNITIDSTQIIEIADKTPPEVNAPDTLVVSAGPDCEADVVAPPAGVSEDCSDEIDVRMQGSFGTIQGNGGLIGNLPLGFHTVIYIATNDCNAEGRDTMIVQVVDDSPPMAICKAAVAIPLGNDGMVTVWASSFDGGSTDNCAPVHFKARRMDAPQGFDCYANDNLSYQFDDVIKFCCEDVGNDNLMIILRIYDVPPVPGVVSNEYLAGHFSECMLRVEIQDKTPPMIQCPTDLTISCEFDFDPDNLSVFGEVVTDPGAQEQICIDDPGNPNTFGLTCVGIEGLATDNCDVTVSHSAVFEIMDNCGTGQVRRTFTATDPGGLTVSCEQSITIINYLPFTESDIIWPPDFHTTDICQVDLLDPSDLPPPYNGPVLSEDECELVAATYRDVVFDFSINHEACFKILRTWTVIDWCQYEPGGNMGIWTHMQVIKVSNTEGPEIELEDDSFEICTDDEACGPGNVQLAASAADDCSGPDALRWTIGVDHDDNGSLDQLFTPIIGDEVLQNIQLPLGTHRILYSVEDFCGNVTTEEQYITMVSCKPPSAKCRNLTTTLMPVDTDGDNEADWGMVVLWAADLDAGSDHVCGNPVQVAFSSDPSDVSRVFDCTDLGPNLVELWVIDDQGNTDYCTVTITIQDNAEVCPSKPIQRAMISGQIKTSSDENVPGIPVMLDGSHLEPQITDELGNYAFPPMSFGGTYRIEPYLNTEHKKGVSTLDLILLQKHLLGLQLLDNPYRIVAADANRSQSLSAMDIVVLRRLILGITQEFPNNTSWRFIDAAYRFIDESNPLPEAFPESYHIPTLSSDMDIDFVAVKVGDLNGSVMRAANGNAVTLRSARPGLDIYVRDRFLKAGEEANIQLLCDEIKEVDALQLTLEWDSELIHISPVHGDGVLSADHMNTFRLEEGLLPVSWTKYDGEIDQAQKILMTLQVRAKTDLSLYDSGIRIGSTIALAEGLNERGELIDPRLAVLPVVENNGAMLVYQNRPNPFSRKTLIPISMPIEDLVQLDVFNAEGRLVHKEAMTMPTGYNEIILDVAQLGHPGVYTCTISASNEIRTLRMIVVGE